MSFTFTPCNKYDKGFAEKAWAHLDTKCMPPRAMGKLERAAVKIACIQQSLKPELGIPAVLIAAGDHGVLAQKVSFAPKSTTWQHSINIVNGGGVAGLFTRKYGMKLLLCDVGADHDFSPADGIVDCKVAHGTKDFTQGPAMTLDQCLKAMEHGRDQVAKLAAEGCRSIIFGEMGIGNTTPASALTMAILNKPAEMCVGSGTGMGSNALLNKQRVVKKAVEVNGDWKDGYELMARLGGLELAFIAGGMLEAAGRGMVILLDGFIVTASALVADMIEPSVRDYMIACHVSKEPGHGLQLGHLELEPLLSMEMCLGEGSGAIIAWPAISAALSIFNEVNSFDEGHLENAADAINEAKSCD
ncbi:MAG: nicotinate-nucleotide--dimethylbenzimidazole phosphoribosyltransferase [bacterium]|nr:nicotinate-nucleotide--dimethylbenzimidazole phosphoribosyltransferase [bacterium]